MIRMLVLESAEYPLPSLPAAHLTTIQFLTDEKVETQEIILQFKAILESHLPPMEDRKQLEFSQGYDDIAGVTAKGSC